MQQYKIAVLGLGSIGTRHFGNVLELGHHAIGFDPCAKKRAATETNFSKSSNAFSLSDSENDAITGADAVIIANPHKYHLQSLQKCVDLKKHCIVEKPIATATEGLDEVLQKANQGNLIIGVGFNLRFRPVVERAKEIMPQLGRMLWGRFICASYLPDWRKGEDYTQNYTADTQTGGIIFDVSHEIDLAYYLLGDAKVVACYADNSGILDIKSEDRANITLKHETGALSHIHLDYITKPKQRGFECAGDKHLLKVDMQSHTLKMYDHDGKLILEETHAPPFNNYEYIEELKDFLNAIDKKQQTRCLVKDGQSNLEIIIQARKFRDI